jgi:hypothetical protein
MRYTIDDYVVLRRSVVPDAAELYEIGDDFSLSAFINVFDERVGKRLLTPY